MFVYSLPPREASGADGLNPDRRDGTVVARPADFDPASCPIIAKHFGIEPPRLIGPVTVEVIAEFPAEIAPERNIATGIERKVARYDALA